MENLLIYCANEENTLKLKLGNEYIGIPIWYQVKNNDVYSFGHCKNYRIPHNNSIQDAIEKEQKPRNIIDFSKSIFGYVDNTVQITGKIFVHDHIAINPKTTDAILQILSTPYPKNEKLYLAGNSTWNETPKIRGYKQYWHRKTDSINDEARIYSSNIPDIEQINFNKTKFRKVKEYNLFELNRHNDFYVTEKTDTSKEKTVFSFTKTLKKLNNQDISEKLKQKLLDKTNKFQFKYAKTIDSGAKFIGKIRFNNLTDEELGALLFVLNLPENCAYKIGMGKPIGLGSLKLIKLDLTLIDRPKRYKSIVSENGEWNLSENIHSDSIPFIEKFKNYMCYSLEHYGDLWQHERMQHLRTMLEFRPNSGSAEWLKKTNYMSLKGFSEAKERLDLPNNLI